MTPGNRHFMQGANSSGAIRKMSYVRIQATLLTEESFFYLPIEEMIVYENFHQDCPIRSSHR